MVLRQALGLSIRLLARHPALQRFPLPQFSGFRESFRFAGESADRGYSVLVFPKAKSTIPPPAKWRRSKAASACWQKISASP